MTLCAVAVTGVGLGLIYPALTRLTLDRTAGRAAGAAVGAMTSRAGIWEYPGRPGPWAGWWRKTPASRAAFWAAAAMALASLAVTSMLPPLPSPEPAMKVGLDE